MWYIEDELLDDLHNEESDWDLERVPQHRFTG